MKQNTILFITTNRHKFEEVRDVLVPYHLEVRQVNRSYPESHDDTLQDIAKKVARQLAEELQQLVMVEDTCFSLQHTLLFQEPFPNRHFKAWGMEDC